MLKSEINRIRKAVKLSDLVLTDHAADRMDERNITIRECLGIIRTGKIVATEDSADFGNVECRLTGSHEGRRLDVVIAVLPDSPPIVIVTIID